ncbi:hypothetical protein MKI84_08125 [Ancylobacter sp. A5.8]|uniref:hypothetical protein n=1 Tax=Ancylobacter gelatini TaxID=2919920 RepID=UPI001F4EE9FF|nr:hypothetical protein [Ancylobacter gelatini]MCJ8142880.1 hypothetical protein [Ancylobacter gelatini]
MHVRLWPIGLAVLLAVSIAIPVIARAQDRRSYPDTAAYVGSGSADGRTKAAALQLAANTKGMQIAIWGSSTAAGLQTPLKQVAADLGMGFHGGGRGGDGNAQILARMGVAPILLDGFTLPAAGPVVVTSDLSVGYSRVGPTYPGYLDLDVPVAGTLGWDAGNKTRIFTRAAAGAPLEVAAGTKFVPDSADLFRGAVSIIGCGKNNVTTRATVENVVWGNRTAYEWLAPSARHVFVLGQFTNRNWEPGEARYDLLEAVRRYEQARYGSDYIDVQGWILSGRAFTDLGIVPTPEDQADLAAGRVPASFFQDSQHLNGKVRRGIVSFLIKPQLVGLSRYEQGVAHATQGGKAQ